MCTGGGHDRVFTNVQQLFSHSYWALLSLFIPFNESDNISTANIV